MVTFALMPRLLFFQRPTKNNNKQQQQQTNKKRKEKEVIIKIIKMKQEEKEEEIKHFGLSVILILGLGHRWVNRLVRFDSCFGIVWIVLSELLVNMVLNVHGNHKAY